MENMENKPEESVGESVGRNEPCPCGSGKKYKRCHGVNAAPKLSVPAMNPMAAAAGSGAGGLPFDINSLDPQWMMQFSQALQRLPAGQMQKLQSIMQKAMAGKDVTREAAEFEKALPPQFQHLLKSFKMPEGAAAPGGMPGVGGMPGMEALQGMNPEELQKAMAEQFAGMDPEELQKQMASMMGGAEGALEVESAPMPQTEDDAKKIVAQALADGKISAEQAAALLGTAETSAGGSEGVTETQAAAAESETASKFSKLWKSFKK